MSNELGIRMKVLKNTGRILDALEDDVTLDPNQEEFQQLIVVPQNPMRGKCATFLRCFFFVLVIFSITSILTILIKGNGTQGVLKRPSQILSLRSNESVIKTPNGTLEDVCLIEEVWKFDCFPAQGATADECLSRGCCWKPLESHLVPWCYYPAGFSYYTFKNFTTSKDGLKGGAISTQKSPYPKDVKNLKIDVIYETEDIIRIKITDPDFSRFEVPLNYNSPNKQPKNQNFNVDTSREGIKVFRKNEQTPIFDSTIAPMIYANQFLQISTTLQTNYVFGIGESVDSLLRNTTWKRFVLYNHDRIPAINFNNYGSHPFYMVMDKSGRSYGVFLANSNAMEVILQPGPALTFRTIGGIIDLRIFMGPSPAEVTEQYTNIIGRPMIPPYWSLGFHLCRFNYGTLNHTEEILENNLKQGLPIDVQWNDLDYMHNQNDFTYDPVNFAGLPDFIADLHKRGMRYVPLIDPGISGGEGKGKYSPYDSGIRMDIFIKDSDGKPFVGKVWNPKSTVWPDFSHPNVTKYWLNQLESFRKAIQFDGAWIDMNEPSNFWDGGATGCSKTSNLDNPPYVPRVDGNTLYRKTICPSAIQAGGSHYDLHNLYGTQETIVTYNVLGDLTNERPFIISRSTFPGQGRFGGHWTGDVISNWEDMKQTIPQILSFGLFGIPMVGADICGFNGNTTVELCKRWQQLGAFYPFARNHNTDDGIPQDPASMGKEVFEAAKETLRVRYDLLPYIYTQFFRAHLSGTPVARALFYEFPTDVNTFFIDKQFMLGPSVMVVPILEEGYSDETIKAYLPKGYWYSHYFYTITESLGEEKMLSIPKNSIPILYRGGTIVVKQKGGQNTVISRKNDFFIQIFLSERETASGEFFWDDGISNFPHELVQYNHYDLKAERGVFTLRKVFDGYDSASMKLGSIEIHGIRGSVSNVVLNNVPFNFKFEEKMLLLSNISLQGTGWTDGLTVNWS